MFFLDGGGACYDATTCAFVPEDPAYDWNVRGDDPSQDGGIFDLGRADNPFRDHSFVFVPSCTGDAHLGQATHEYSPDLTVEHKGYVNGTAALDYLAEHFPTPPGSSSSARPSDRSPHRSTAASSPTGSPMPR